MEDQMRRGEGVQGNRSVGCRSGGIRWKERNRDQDMLDKMRECIRYFPKRRNGGLILIFFFFSIFGAFRKRTAEGQTK